MRFLRASVAAILVIIVAFTAVYSAVAVSTSELSYDANGGHGAPEALYVQKGSEAVVSDIVPQMDGFRFSGWSADRFADRGDIQPGSILKLDSDVKLYAIWVPCGDVVVLSDAGLDDAIALTSLFREADLFDSITVVAVAGNCNQNICLNNVRKVVELNSMQDTVRIVSTLSINQNSGDATLIHGTDGLGDIYHFEPTVGYTEYGSWISTVVHIDWLVSLGGCTVTKMIYDAVDVGNLLLMGGFNRCDPFYGDLEFNQMMDHDAFSYCVGRDHRIATIDTGTLSEALDVLNWDVIGNSPAKRLFRIYQQNCIEAKDTFIAIWDDIAITYLLHPQRFTYQAETDIYGDTLNNLVYLDSKYNPCGIRPE